MHKFMGPTFLWFVQPKVHPINGNTVATKHPEVSEIQLAIMSHAYILSYPLQLTNIILEKLNDVAVDIIEDNKSNLTLWCRVNIDTYRLRIT